MGRKKQIDTSMYFCPRKECSNYGKVGTDNQIIGAGTYGKRQTQLLKCNVCGRRFSARPVFKTTISFNGPLIGRLRQKNREHHHTSIHRGIPDGQRFSA